MKTFKAGCGCEIHVIKWTAKSNSVTMRSCPLHKNSDLMISELRNCLDDAERLGASPRETIKEYFTRVGRLEKVISLCGGPSTNQKEHTSDVSPDRECPHHNVFSLCPYCGDIEE